MAASQSLLSAWEPLTPRGVAAFARAASGRLLLVQLLVALVVAASVVWFLHDSWGPIIREAIEQLPDEGIIRSGKLDWPGQSPQLLAEGTFLAFSVDLEHRSELRSPAHVQIEFGKETWIVYSLLGYAEMRYPSGWSIAFNRKELKPWWGAWQPAMLAGVAGAVGVGLLTVWYVLATVYAIPVWLVAFFANRALKLHESCRLAGAALLPGALLMVVAILCYDRGLLHGPSGPRNDLVVLSFVAIGHIVVGWIYLFISPLFLPRNSESGLNQKNPFAMPDKK